MAILGQILSDGQQGVSNSLKTQLDILNGRRASASQRDGVIMQLRDQRVPKEFIDAHLPQTEDGPALLAGAGKAVEAYRGALVNDLKSKGVADELVNAHVPSDLTRSAEFASGADAAFARHQELTDRSNAAVNSSSFIQMPK